MKTFALLFLGLAVALGLPLEKKETLAAPEADQRPLVGDLLPAQGHVVVEQPAPQPELSKPQQQPAPPPDAKQQIIEVVEVKQESNQDNEIQPEQSNQDETGLLGHFEPKADIIETLVEEEDQKQHEETPEEETGEYEESVMKPEPISNEEMQNAESAENNFKDDEVYEEPPVKEGDSEGLEQHQDEAGLVGYFEPNADMVETLVEDKEQKMNEETPEEETDKYEESVMKLEPVINEEMQNAESAGTNFMDNGVYSDAPEQHQAEMGDLETHANSVVTLVENENQKPKEETPEEETDEYEESVMKLEPISNEEMQNAESVGTNNDVYEEPEMHLEPESEGYQGLKVEEEEEGAQAGAMEEEGPMLDALGQPLSLDGEFMSHGTNFMDNGVYEEPEMHLEPESEGYQAVNEGYMPQALAMEEEGPMLDALGQPLSMDEGSMRLEPEEQTETSMERVEHGGRSCPGMVLEGQCFQFFTTPKKASAAEFFCQTFPGGHLAAITSAHVHGQMMALMRQHGGTRRTWVGGLRLLDSNRFLWLDGSSWNYADWLWGEPNNTSGLENCVELLASGKFNDFTCWEPQAFICSYPYQ
ncbi:unnamed protein product [Knipowitschia caucasica]|uniref:C-type lectin domain-containing protein n=1 Tax=Knipowitschia caucasica TaxID=637954 RepID=A0AAV2K1Q3_KNICA